MNYKRLISGLLGFPFVVILFIFANIYVVDIAVAVIAIMAMHEYFNALKQKTNPVVELGYLSAALIAVIHLIEPINALKIIAIIVPILILILFLKVILSNMKVNIVDISVTFFGICYIVLFLMFLPIIHGMDNGKIFIWYVPFIAWGTDIFAYVIGKKIGKHKFSQVSPNKSIEGCIGGIIGAIIVTSIYTLVINTYLGMSISYIYIGIMTILLSVISQIGDFAASSIKRYAGIKDFSNLIPGHGGMLDRIDSLIFIAPFAYLFLMFL